MPCYHPLTAWRSTVVGSSGKVQITFDRREARSLEPLTLPCGQCIGCRLERSRQWAIRCMHEASLYEDNCFISLTYAPEHLPETGSLVLRDLQLFMKRLRKRFSPLEIRFFACGEYGEKYRRPHYHVCLFNYRPDDLVHYKNSPTGIRYYTSETLSKLWRYGHVVVGELTFESAAYVARYVTKKITGERAENHYSSVDGETGEVYRLRPEFVTMSRRPGIASNWFKRFPNDVYPSDHVVVRGIRCKPPKYYDGQLEITDPDLLKSVKDTRKREMRKHQSDNTPDRLEAKEFVKNQKARLLARSLEAQS